MTDYAFFEGNFVPVDKAKISIKTHALQYGTGIFEGIRAYWSEEKAELFVFRMRDHFERMADNMKILHIDCKFSIDELYSLTTELLKKNAPRTDTYIRPFAYKNSTRVGPGLQDNPSELSIYTVPFGAYFKAEDGLRVMVSNWRRVDDNAIPPRAKISGAYANTALAKTDAVNAGFDDAIVLDQGGHVSEGSAMNIFMVKKGTLITTPSYENILVGITRSSVIEFALNEFDMIVKERKIDRSELYTADELFFCGTGAQVVPVVEVDKRKIGTGTMGPITKMVLDTYKDITHGRMESYNKWLTPIYAESGNKIGAR
ncbi:MAG: branched-chain amino acid transaminase [Candidatus Obscuribacterales bacterium]|nr:branched-chain amino acid transaminase [Candidatus Obscuribacterales bacterium]